ACRRRMAPTRPGRGVWRCLTGAFGGRTVLGRVSRIIQPAVLFPPPRLPRLPPPPRRSDGTSRGSSRPPRLPALPPPRLPRPPPPVRSPPRRLRRLPSPVLSSSPITPLSARRPPCDASIWITARSAWIQETRPRHEVRTHERGSPGRPGHHSGGRVRRGRR